MAQNDNLTPQVQKAIEEQEARLQRISKEQQPGWLETLRIHYHPNIKGMPDYGIGTLKLETEAYCRALCEKNAMSYDDLKEEYALSTQVIQARERNPITSQLIKKGVCPINRLDAFFTAHVQGAVNMKRRIRADRAQQIEQEFADVK